MGFFRQEYGSGLPCPSPGGLSEPGIEPRSPALQVDSLLSEPPGKPMPNLPNSVLFLQCIPIQPLPVSVLQVGADRIAEGYSVVPGVGLGGGGPVCSERLTSDHECP